MGIGFAMTEGRVLDRNTGQDGQRQLARLQDPHRPGRAAATRLPARSTRTTRSATATGTKGIGEPATIPTAAAIANAVYHATGIRVTEPPINPVQMARLLAERRAGR